MQAFAAILLKSPACPAQLPAGALDKLAAAFGATAVRSYEALDGSEAYIYLDLKGQSRTPQAFAAAVQTKAAELFANTSITAMALSGASDMAGANEGEAAPFFYTVEITAKRENMAAIAEWYEQEHMPGLAAVPGCVHARRYLTDGAEQTSCACYELNNAGIRETAAWNAVRGTPWSQKVRPYFLNLKRNMFRALPK
jgi:hypothetical protein